VHLGSQTIWDPEIRPNLSGSQLSLGRESIGEWCNLARLLMAFPIGSVENERPFSLMNLVHTTLRNRLDETHLNCCVRVAANKQNAHTIDTQAVHNIWFAGKSLQEPPQRTQVIFLCPASSACKEVPTLIWKAYITGMRFGITRMQY
jgi:hypothetical protein